MGKRLMGKLLALISVPGDNPRLLVAQFGALSRQLPMMYMVLLINTWALAFTHWDSAPQWLALWIPVLLTLVCGARSVMWWQMSGNPPPVPIIRTMLARTNRLAIFIALGFTAWSLALYPYGNAYAQAHVAFFMSITVIVCIFCMMHLMPAALITTMVVNIGFVVFFSSTRNPTFIATAVNIVLVSVALLAVLQNNYRTFTGLINAQAHTEQLSNENLRLANLDSLTGLPNRRQFFSALDQALAFAHQRHRTLAVGILDLDGFKSVNDLYGHGIGDRLLMSVGQRLQAFADTITPVHVARLGGDEFALIVGGGRDDAALTALGADLCARLKEEFVIAGMSIQVGATLGMATYPHTAHDATQLFEYADYALYQGKRHNPGALCLFSAAHHTQLRHDAMTEQALRRSQFGNEFYVQFQPIIDARTRVTVAFEALARWTSPELGRVSPACFIPIAERSGLINRLTLALLRTALEQANTWPSPIRLAFNLSAHDCASEDNVTSILEVISQSGFAPERLDLEITETAIVQDVGEMERAIARLRALGCGISLDDFGTGYTSLGQLHALPLTKLKIDRSFVSDIQHKPAHYKIVKSLVALTQDMNLECVIEGVETEEELAALTQLGCTLVQGFLFSRPLGFDDTLAWLNETALQHPAAC